MNYGLRLRRSERRILSLLANGYDYSGVAHRLGWSYRSVKNTANRIFRCCEIEVGRNRLMVLMRLVTGDCVRCESSWQRLNFREREILLLALQGHRTSYIAARFDVAPQIVRNVVRNIYNKSGCSNRVELAIHFLVKRHEKFCKIPLFRDRHRAVD